MAQKEAHAIKFADKVVVNFQCSIRLDIKDAECPVSLSFHFLLQNYLGADKATATAITVKLADKNTFFLDFLLQTIRKRYFQCKLLKVC